VKKQSAGPVVGPFRLNRLLLSPPLFAWCCAAVVSLMVGCSPTTTSKNAADKRDAAKSPSSDLTPGQDATSPQASVASGFGVDKELEALGVQLRSNAKSQKTESADFSKVEINDQLALKLAQLESLTQMVLRQSAMSDSGWDSLSKLTNLQNLDLRECPINSSQLLKLTAAMPQLRSLRLSGKAGNCAVDDTGLENIAKLSKLKLLALDGIKVGDPGLAQLGQCTMLAELYLGDTQVSDATLSQLTTLRDLKKLRLSQTSVTGSGIAQLSGLPIEELDVSVCANIDDVASTAIGKLTSLKRLNMWSTSITDAAVKHLGQLTRLQWLNLDNTQITDAGLPLLKGLTEVGFLHLGSTQVSDAGLPSLTALSSLKQLVVTRTKVTKAGVDALQKMMPAVDIQLEYVAGR
jgi:Leucine-rich repeat (LRR) protein